MYKYIITTLFFLLYSTTNSAQINTLESDSIKKPTEKEWKLSLNGFFQVDGMFDFQEMRTKEGFNSTSITESNKNIPSTYFGIKQSQLKLLIQEIDEGKKSDLSIFIEVDFHGPNNTTVPRFRHGYIKWKKFLIGQTWSNFADLYVWPNTIDFFGANGALLSRPIQIRYETAISKKGKIILTLEDPNAISLTLPNDKNWEKKPLIPALTSAYVHNIGKNHFKVAGILSSLNYTTDKQPDKLKSNISYGVLLSGKLHTSNLNSIRLQTSYGKGYANRNVVLSSSGYDAVPDIENDRLKSLNLFNIFGIYEHWWSSMWSSIFYYSHSQLDKNSITPTNMVQNFQSKGINLIYKPYQNLRIGTEITHGSNRRVSGDVYNAYRIQCSTSLSF